MIVDGGKALEKWAPLSAKTINVLQRLGASAIRNGLFTVGASAMLEGKWPTNTQLALGTALWVAWEGAFIAWGKGLEAIGAKVGLSGLFSTKASMGRVKTILSDAYSDEGLKAADIDETFINNWLKAHTRWGEKADMIKDIKQFATGKSADMVTDVMDGMSNGAAIIKDTKWDIAWAIEKLIAKTSKGKSADDKLLTKQLEWMLKRIDAEWGIGATEANTVKRLIAERLHPFKQRGIGEPQNLDDAALYNTIKKELEDVADGLGIDIRAVNKEVIEANVISSVLEKEMLKDSMANMTVTDWTKWGWKQLLWKGLQSQVWPFDESTGEGRVGNIAFWQGTALLTKIPGFAIDKTIGLRTFKNWVSRLLTKFSPAEKGALEKFWDDGKAGKFNRTWREFTQKNPAAESASDKMSEAVVLLAKEKGIPLSDGLTDTMIWGKTGKPTTPVDVTLPGGEPSVPAGTAFPAIYDNTISARTSINGSNPNLAASLQESQLPGSQLSQNGMPPTTGLQWTPGQPWDIAPGQESTGGYVDFSKWTTWTNVTEVAPLVNPTPGTSLASTYERGFTLKNGKIDKEFWVKEMLADYKKLSPEEQAVAREIYSLKNIIEASDINTEANEIEIISHPLTDTEALELYKPIIDKVRKWAYTPKELIFINKNAPKSIQNELKSAGNELLGRKPVAPEVKPEKVAKSVTVDPVLQAFESKYQDNAQELYRIAKKAVEDGIEDFESLSPIKRASMAAMRRQKKLAKKLGKFEKLGMDKMTVSRMKKEMSNDFSADQVKLNDIANELDMTTDDLLTEIKDMYENSQGLSSEEAYIAAQEAWYDAKVAEKNNLWKDGSQYNKGYEWNKKQTLEWWSAQWRGVVAVAETPSKEANKTIQDAVDKYAKARWMEVQRDYYVDLDAAHHRKVAKAYDALKVDNSADPRVAKAYTALVDELKDQWVFVEKELGIKMEWWTKEGQPYANSKEMRKDVADNNHLYFFTGGEPHPFLDKVDPKTGYSYNEMFRALHDIFWHSSEWFSFSARWEENAFLKHSQMFSEDAQKALATETRGQNSWVNYGDQNYDKAGNRLDIAPADRPYAVQKVDILPDKFTEWRSSLGLKKTDKVNLLWPGRAKSKDFKIGITPVKWLLTNAGDSLVDEANNLFSQGRFDEAQAKYSEAITARTDDVKKAFENTGITIKNKWAWLGIFEGNREPNMDLTATVPEGKEELLQSILADLSWRQWKQKSVMTYRNAPIDAPLWRSTTSPGKSVDPRININFSRSLSLDEKAEIAKIAQEAWVDGASFRDDGKTLDIIKLSSNNTDYEKFYEAYDALQAKLARYTYDRGISSSSIVDKQETWVAWAKIGDAPTTYRQVQDLFRTKNPEYLNRNEKYTSEVIEKIGNRKVITRPEVEAIIKNGGISDIEKNTVTDLIQKYEPKEKIPASQLQKEIIREMLPIYSKDSDKYSHYGLDNIGLDYDSGTVKTIIYGTGVRHGKSGHFDDPGLFGHARIAAEWKQGYVVEVQSDLFQHDLPDLRRDTRTTDGILSEIFNEKDNGWWNGNRVLRDLKEKILAEHDHPSQLKYWDFENYQWIDAMQWINFDPVDNAWTAWLPDIIKPIKKLSEDDQRLAWRLMEEYDKNVENYAKKLEKPAALLEAFWKKDKYRERLINETMYKLKEVGATEMNVATPSTAAKIEWFVSDDGSAPYDHANGDRVTPDDSDFSQGDEISYGGEEYTVVWTDRHTDDIQVAPSDKVQKIDLYDFIKSESEYRFDETVKAEELKDDLEKWITPERAAELSSEHYWPTARVLDLIAGQEETITMENIDSIIREDAIEKISENMDAFEDLSDIYWRGNVFSDGRDDTVFVIEEWTNYETFTQPSQYATGAEWLDAIDENPDEMSNFNFGSDQESVLKNYYELKDYLDKYAKENNITVTRTEDPNGNTWFTLPIIPGKIKWF